MALAFRKHCNAPHYRRKAKGQEKKIENCLRCGQRKDANYITLRKTVLILNLEEV